jgi:hypothetical protein
MEEIAHWRQVDRTLGFYDVTKFGHPTYNWIALHLGVLEEEQEIA